MSNALESMLKEVDAEIRALADKRTQLIQELNDKKTKEDLEKFNSWNVSPNDNVALIAKADFGTHWSILKLFKIKEIDTTHKYIDTITTDYHESDYEYWVKTEENRVYFSNLEELEKTYNIYKVNEPMYDFLQKQMYTLSLTYKSIKTVTEQLKSVASQTIHESVE